MNFDISLDIFSPVSYNILKWRRDYMEIIRPLEDTFISAGKVACFLAGGCSSLEWRDGVYKELNNHRANSLVIVDPYNPNIQSVFQQIQWEFKYLNDYIQQCFIFSCYFDKYTDQPISMYELGRASVLCKPQQIELSIKGNKSVVSLNWGFPMIVSVHPEAPKKQDLIIQCGLAKVECVERTPEEHAKEIINWYRELRQQMGI